MAETEQSPLKSVTPDTEKLPKFSIWPPAESTREAIRSRLIQNISKPSLLSNKYGTVSHEEAVDTAERIEEEAFGVAGKTTVAEDDDIEILQVYSKEISKRMLATIKARSGEPATSESETGIEEVVNAEEEDAASTAPPQSEKVESVPDDE